MVKINGDKVSDLEQEKGDPLSEEICKLREKVFELEKEINNLIKDEKKLKYSSSLWAENKNSVRETATT